jgi:tetratricopeptide (TPR) repeat protein
MPATLLPELDFALQEYKVYLLVTANFPTSQLCLAQLALAMANKATAQKHFEQALTIAPYLPLAMLSFADFWRQTNNQTKELALLEKAINLHTDLADVLHQLGLYWVRKKEYYTAANWLVKASNLADAQPYYAYVAATALDSIKRTNQAIELLVNANNRWPKQADLLYSLALYTDKSLDKTNMKIALDGLQELIPNDPQVNS